MRSAGLSRVILVFCLFLACWQLASGQGVGGSPLRKRFEAYNDSYFQEKVFVHMSKDSYQGDEIMWFKAYRVDATAHSPKLYSGLVYADIFDPANKQVARIQLARTDSCFHGSYKLPPTAVSGYYTLTAYTYWMQNYSEEFYFSKRFYVNNVKDRDIRSGVEYAPDYNSRKVIVTATFLRSDSVPYRNSAFRVVPVSAGREMHTLTGVANREGQFRFEIAMDSMVTDLRMSFDGDNKERERYARVFKVPVFDDRLDVQFMPEGGHLLDGVMQRVAFKVVGADGRSAEAGGTVVNQNGNMVAMISTTHNGMGEFRFKPRAEERYTARLITPDGREMRVALPAVAAAGIGITASTQSNTLSTRVVSTAGFDYGGLGFVMQCRGKVLMWKPLADAMELKVPLGQLPEGIVHLFIVNNNGRVYSERLVFVNNDRSARMTVKGLKPSYGKRELVEAEIDLSGMAGGQQADLSVSVVDTRRSLTMPSDNIVSYILMSSDIKGKVEEPWRYFDATTDANTRAAYADLLMMTQGWKRFDLGAVFRSEGPALGYAVELGQSISGRITNVWNEEKALKTPKLAMVAPGIKRGWIIEPDEEGYFEVSDVWHPIRTGFLIYGTQKKKSKGVVGITIDKQQFKPYTPWPGYREIFRPESGAKQGKAETETAFDFYDAAAPRYVYVDGEKVYVINTVSVTAKKERDKELDMWGDNLLVRVTPEEILDTGLHTTLRSWLKSQEGVEITDDPHYDETGEYHRKAVYINGRRARFLMDGGDFASDYLLDDRIMMETGGLFQGASHTVFSQPITGTQEILDVPMSAISKVSIIQVGTEIGSTSYGYSVNVQTKALSGLYTMDKPYRFEFYPLGYNVPDAFYEPVYGTANDNPDPDQRVTLHWEPDVTTGPDGKAKVSFYMNDIPSDYLMTIQGITSQGQPVFRQATFSLRGR